jgi:hypothetical protein
LNVLLKALQKDRIFIHCLDEETFNTVDGTATYTPTTGTKRILSARIKISGTDTPISVKSISEYDLLTNKTSEGLPVALYVDPANTGMILHPVPDAVYAIYYRRERSLMDFDAATDNPDFPITGARLLIKGLALDLAPAYRVGLEERMLLKQEFTQEKQEYVSGNTERTGKEIVIPSMVV